MGLSGPGGPAGPPASHLGSLLILPRCQGHHACWQHGHERGGCAGAAGCRGHPVLGQGPWGEAGQVPRGLAGNFAAHGAGRVQDGSRVVGGCLPGPITIAGTLGRVMLEQQRGLPPLWGSPRLSPWPGWGGSPPQHLLSLPSTRTAVWDKSVWIWLTQRGKSYGGVAAGHRWKGHGSSKENGDGLSGGDGKREGDGVGKEKGKRKRWGRRRERGREWRR